MKKVFCALGLMVVFATPVYGQSIERKPSFKLPTVVFAAAASADWVTTYRNISHGGDEANPTLRWLGQKPKAVVALGAATDVVGVWAWNKWVGAKHPKLAKVGLYVAAGARFYIAFRNHQRLNEHFRGLR